jgi:hypothetical protein
MNDVVILIIYFDSFCFVFATALINQGLGLNTSSAVCSGAIYICLAFYMTTKILIYLFLVERVVSATIACQLRILLKNKPVADRAWTPEASLEGPSLHI